VGAVVFPSEPTAVAVVGVVRVPQLVGAAPPELELELLPPEPDAPDDDDDDDGDDEVLLHASKVKTTPSKRLRGDIRLPFSVLSCSAEGDGTASNDLKEEDTASLGCSGADRRFREICPKSAGFC
jgi:hypothetical protein